MLAARASSQERYLSKYISFTQLGQYPAISFAISQAIFDFALFDRREGVSRIALA